MRCVLDPPVEALIALRSRWAKRVLTDEGAEIRQVGRWVSLFVVEEDDEYGEPFFAEARYWHFGDELQAVMAFDTLLERVIQ